ALPEYNRKKRSAQQQQAGAEDFVAETEPREVAVGAEAHPVDPDVDQRRYDQQEQELHEVDAKAKARHGQHQDEPQPRAEISRKVRKMMPQHAWTAAAAPRIGRSRRYHETAFVWAAMYALTRSTATGST